MVKFVTNARSATWWPKLEPMLIALRVGQIWNQFWWHHLVVKFSTNTSGTTYNWPNLEPMQVAFYLAWEITQVKIWNQFWWHHLVLKFWTNTSGTTYNWPNLEPMQVVFYLAGEITQVIDSTPWVRCASGNVLSMPPLSICGCALLYECACGNINIHFGLFICQVSITFFQNTGKHMPQFGFVQGDFFKKFQVQKT